MLFLHATIFFLDKEMKKKYIGKANKEIETPTKNKKKTQQLKTKFLKNIF